MDTHPVGEELETAPHGIRRRHHLNPTVLMLEPDLTVLDLESQGLAGCSRLGVSRFVLQTLALHNVR